MAREIIDTSTDHGTYKGDPAKVAFEKANANFAELYAGQQTMAQLAGKNMLRNCGIPINQRNFAGGALALGVFGYDRWKGGNGGCNIVINSSGVWTLNGPVQQVVQAPQNAWGKPVTFSAESPSGPISVYMSGAVGTIPAGAGRQSVTLTANGSGNMLVDISTASSTTFSQLQMERGEKATAFEVRDIDLELLLCMQFFETLRIGGTCGAISAQNQVLGFHINWKVPKRGSPSVALVAGSESVTAFPLGLAALTETSSIGAIAFKMATGSSSNAGWYQTVAVDAEL